jgi:hypothetical protein
MVQVFKYIPTAASTKACLSLANEMDKVHTTFPTVEYTKGNGIMVRSKVLVFVSGKMVGFMKGIG